MTRYRINEKTKAEILDGNFPTDWGQIPLDVLDESFELVSDLEYPEYPETPLKLTVDECERIGLESDNGGCGWYLSNTWVTRDISDKLDLI
jgi:hypothetical protein